MLPEPERLRGAPSQPNCSVRSKGVIFSSHSGPMPRVVLPSLKCERLTQGRIRLHDLRHTLRSLLIQAGASIVYVKEQMGHSSIQVPVDTYGHLIPGANISSVDRLDVLEQKVKTTRNNPQPALDGRQYFLRNSLI